MVATHSRRSRRDLRGLPHPIADEWDHADIPPRDDSSRQKIIDHPAVGRITVDCDTLIVAADDLRVMVYSAEPATADAERLALAIVLGTQSLVE